MHIQASWRLQFAKSPNRLIIVQHVSGLIPFAYSLTCLIGRLKRTDTIKVDDFWLAGGLWCKWDAALIMSCPYDRCCIFLCTRQMIRLSFSCNRSSVEAGFQTCVRCPLQSELMHQSLFHREDIRARAIHSEICIYHVSFEVSFYTHI